MIQPKEGFSELSRRHQWMYAAGLLLLFISATIIYFSFLNWGTPSWQKTLSIFGTQENYRRWVPILIEQRESYYKTKQEMLNPNSDFKKLYRDLFHGAEDISEFSPIPQSFILDRLRGFIIGTVNSDEQNTMRAISKMNPIQGRFNPGVDTFYGGVYYYICGGVLFLAKALGLVQLVPGIAFYFDHPDQIARMFLIVRSIGAVSALLSLVLLVAWVSRWRSLATAQFAGWFLLSFPIVAVYAHLAKAHLLGMLLTLLGCYFLELSHSSTDNQNRNSYLGAIFLGLSAGSIITNLSVGIFIFLSEWARQNWQVSSVLRSRRFWFGSALFFSIYASSNWYILADWASFQRMLQSVSVYTSGYDKYGEINFSAWLPFLKNMFTMQMPWLVLPFLIAGLYSAFQERNGKNRFLFVIALGASFLVFLNLLSTRHPGVNIRVFPLLAWLSAEGALSLYRGTWRGLVIVFSTVLILFALQRNIKNNFLLDTSEALSAGSWINSNIPSQSTIGVDAKTFSQETVPPFEWLNYKLVNISLPIDSAGKSQLPDYIISNAPFHFSQGDVSYDLVQSFENPISDKDFFLGIKKNFLHRSQFYVHRKKTAADFINKKSFLSTEN